MPCASPVEKTGVKCSRCNLDFLMLVRQTAFHSTVVILNRFSGCNKLGRNPKLRQHNNIALQERYWRVTAVVVDFTLYETCSIGK